MQIALKQLEPSPRPVRTSWDEKAMNGLARSIKEQGLIVPIKIRALQDWADKCTGMHKEPFPMLCVNLQASMLEEYGTSGVELPDDLLCKWCEYAMKGEPEIIREYGEEWFEEHAVPQGWKPFEIVYGHRRVEASKRAGLKYIEAIIEEVDNTGALIQTLIENIQREDLKALDKARGLKALMEETGWSTYEIGKRGIMSQQRASELLNLLGQSEVVQQLLTQERKSYRPPVGLGSITAKHVDLVSRVKLPRGVHDAVLQKAAQEGWTAEKAGQEASKLKKRLAQVPEKPLEAEGIHVDLGVVTPEIKARVAAHTKKQAAEKEQRWWDDHASGFAKKLITSTKRSRKMFEEDWIGVEKGAIGAEHMPYIENKLRELAAYLIGLADELNVRRIQEVTGE